MLMSSLGPKDGGLGIFRLRIEIHVSYHSEAHVFPINLSSRTGSFLFSQGTTATFKMMLRKMARHQ